MHSLRVLLIEDDLDDIDLFQYALKTNGITCTLDVLMQGDEVVPYLAGPSNRPDIVIMDLNLPLVHGRDVLKQIRSAQSFKEIPLVVLTTSSAKEDLDYCYAMGADQFITKPTTLTGFNSLAALVVSMAKDEMQATAAYPTANTR